MAGWRTVSRRMARFKAVLIEHGYSSSKIEREILTAAGGEFIDASEMPLEQALRLCEDAEGVMLRRIEVPAEMLDEKFAAWMPEE